MAYKPKVVLSRGRADARTSTTEQVAGLEAQERDLIAAGCEAVFAEQVSATATKRPKLAALLFHIRGGDVVMVTKPDRLARSVADLLALKKQIHEKNATLRVLSMGSMGKAANMELDTGNPTSDLMLTILGAVAEFEKALMLERQREGIAKAKAEGRYTGRQPTARAKESEVRALVAAKVGPSEIARRLGIGRSSVHRILTATAAEGTTP